MSARAVAVRGAICVGLALAALARADVEPGSGMRYVVVPPTGAADAPAPLLVCLHGTGDSPEGFQRGLRSIAPSVRRFRCVFIQSPPDGWQQDQLEGVARVASAVVAAHPTRGAILLGYSAGAWIGAVECWRHPDLFEGGLLIGSIGLQKPPRALARQATPSIFWSVGTVDPATTHNGGFDLAALERHLVDIGWDRARWQIDAREGQGHSVDGPSVERGLAFLARRLELTTPATDDDRAAAARVPALIAAGDLPALRALVEPISSTRRGEAKSLLATALLELPRARDPAASQAGLQLLGALGDERAVSVIAGLLPNLTRDPTRQLAAIEALGALGGEDAATALLKVARRADDGGAQVAAVRALARCGGRDEVAPLTQELDEAERGKRQDVAAALEAALREITGQELHGARTWRAWREQLLKSERATQARQRAASEAEARERDAGRGEGH